MKFEKSTYNHCIDIIHEKKKIKYITLTTGIIVVIFLISLITSGYFNYGLIMVLLYLIILILQSIDLYRYRAKLNELRNKIDSNQGLTIDEFYTIIANSSSFPGVYVITNQT